MQKEMRDTTITVPIPLHRELKIGTRNSRRTTGIHPSWQDLGVSSARRDSLRPLGPLTRNGGYDIVLAWKSSLKSPRIRSMEALLLPRSVKELRPKQTLLPICVRWLKMQSNAISTMQNKCQRLFACISSVTKSCRYEAAARSRRKPADQSAASARLFHRPPAG